jgi:hypothetical protein
MGGSRLPILLVLVALSCGHATRKGASGGPQEAVSPAGCQMVEAALRVAVEERSGTGLGVTAECARELAGLHGKLQVDVVGSGAIASKLGESCVLNSYVIRPLASKERAPTKAVVYFTAKPGNERNVKFEVSVIPSNWRELPEDIYPTSPCGVADGELRRSPNGWAATLTQP